MRGRSAFIIKYIAKCSKGIWNELNRILTLVHVKMKVVPVNDNCYRLQFWGSFSTLRSFLKSFSQSKFFHSCSIVMFVFCSTLYLAFQFFQSSNHHKKVILQEHQHSLNWIAAEMWCSPPQNPIFGLNQLTIATSQNLSGYPMLQIPLIFFY